MNFQSLKSMIDNLIQTYNCGSCNSKVDESNVEVVWTAWTNVNVEIECPQCKKHTIVRAQVYALDVPTSSFSPEQITQLKEKISESGWLSAEALWDIELSLEWIKENKNSIKDTSIVEISKKLKTRNISVDDIFTQIDE